MNENSFRNSTSDVKIAETQSKSRDLNNLIEQVEDYGTKDYIKNRVVPSMQYYSDMSRRYKKQYLRLMTATVLLGALVPVCVVFSDSTNSMKALLISLSVGATAINLYLSLNNSKDLWKVYRSTREALESTLYFYFNHVGVFSDERETERNHTLIKQCESELARENNAWRLMMER